VTSWRVPTVDISPYVEGGSPQTRARVARAIDEANCTVGFVQILGHGIADDVLGKLRSAMDEFFDLPTEVKTAYRSPPAINRGYSPPKSESLSLSLGVEPSDQQYDFFEAFNIGAAASSFAGLALPAVHYPENLWPAEVATFARDVDVYFREAGRVARVLTTIFADALGVESGFFDTFTDHSVDVLRLNNYALASGEHAVGEMIKGMGEHTDYGIVTVLWAEQVPGLQVLGSDGIWHDVLPDDGALLVNLGDLTARWTNERWLSTLHRVTPPVVDGVIRRRRSAAFFHDGNAEAEIATISTCIGEGDISLYDPITVEAHLAAKLGGSRAGRRNDHAGREGDRVRSAARPSTQKDNSRA
jgi:isopenicillin N synthase-like dioxygenase